MKFVCIDDGAAAELVSGRQYQSIDFQEGERLIRGFRSDMQFAAQIRNIFLLQSSDSVHLATKGQWKQKRFLVIDCETSSLFNTLPPHDSLTSFQKLLRFCIKYWTGGTYSKSEKIISGTSKAVVFPLPFAANAPFRIAIERQPLKDRLQKRDMDGRFLLVYKTSTEDANSATEAVDETNFRRAFEGLAEVYDNVATLAQHAPRLEGEMATTDLTQSNRSKRPSEMPFPDWLPLLTTQQRQFVFSDAPRPHALRGPAGTGKTLALMLKTARLLMEQKRKGAQWRALVVTHSEETRKSISNAFSAITPSDFINSDASPAPVSLSVETLASLCAKTLVQSISESEFIDRDAQDSKVMQGLYIERALHIARDSDLPSFRPLLSERMKTLVDSDINNLVEIFQHEISVAIKGRAGDSFDVYKACPPLKYGLPTASEADKGFAYKVFRHYQSQLAAANQFDTDDVVISAIGQLDTPIWRRRRVRDGFDFIAIDETHLFNINELHVFHHFTRGPEFQPISFTLDQAQAVGDRGWGDSSAATELIGDSRGADVTSVSAIFRSAPNIIEFSHSILASGATLFTNFVNTLTSSYSTFTPEEERRAQPVTYYEFSDDAEMVAAAFKIAEDFQGRTQSTKSEVLITTLSDHLINDMHALARSENKPITLLDKRGDFLRVKHAERSGHSVLGHADFVGGLEFNVVVIVGVDRGRVPHEGGSTSFNSRNYASYSAHNRLYVASSRARFALCLLGVKSRGPSELLLGASSKGLIEGISTA